jgi:hypothetical protein
MSGHIRLRRNFRSLPACQWAARAWPGLRLAPWEPPAPGTAAEAGRALPLGTSLSLAMLSGGLPSLRAYWSVVSP